VGNNKVQGKDAVDFFTQNKVATVRVVDPKVDDSTPTPPTDNSVRSCVAS
jgi:malonate-semialdehyde dehydrogenase (acetylating)/methylmalonate-semialdehyde dehydrogenase